MSRWLIAGAGACLLLVTACGRDSDRAATTGSSSVGTTSLTSADVQSTIDAAISRIARERCESGEACRQIGPVTHDLQVSEMCLATMKAELGKKLDLQSCPRGVNSSKVATCVAATQGAGCDDPLAGIARLEECTASRMCF